MILHVGNLKTYLRLVADWYWKGMRKAVAGYVQRCGVCQQQKVSQQSLEGLLHGFR